MRSYFEVMRKMKTIENKNCKMNKCGHSHVELLIA